MKKQIFFLAVAAMAMASCSQDETIGINEGKGIGFRTSADKITRGSEINNSNITEFYASAFDPKGDKYFADQLFEGAYNSTFESDPLYYWPGDNSTLTFRAYAPDAETIGGTMSLGLTDNTLTEFSPAAEIADQVDLIYATATGNKDKNEATGVKLTFSHMLSQIEVKAKNSNTGYVYKVKGVKIANVKQQGDLDFDKAVSQDEKASAWSNLSETKTSYSVEYTEVRTLNETAQTLMSENGDNAMLIPQQLTAWDNTAGNKNNDTYLAVLVNVETKDGAQVYPKNDADTEEYEWVAVGIDTKWEMGKHYIYTLDFSEGAGRPEPDPTDPEPDEPVDPVLGGPIKFTVEVTGWEKQEATPDLSWDAE